MEKITAIIVDDERNGRENLVALLLDFCPQVKIAGTAVSVPEATGLIRELQPQLVFLDIEMPVKNGFGLLEAFDNYPFEVIFVTAYDQYAIQAIRFSAADYILKPVNSNELIAAVERVSIRIRDKQENRRLRFLHQNLQQPLSPKIGLATGDHVDFVPVNTIIRCKGEGNYTLVVLADKKQVLVAKTLVEFEELLKKYGFIRVHKTHLVNINHITAFIRSESSLILSNKEKIPVSRRRKDFVRKELKASRPEAKQNFNY